MNHTAPIATTIAFLLGCCSASGGAREQTLARLPSDTETMDLLALYYSIMATYFRVYSSDNAVHLLRNGTRETESGTENGVTSSYYSDVGVTVALDTSFEATFKRPTSHAHNPSVHGVWVRDDEWLAGVLSGRGKSAELVGDDMGRAFGRALARLAAGGGDGGGGDGGGGGGSNDSFAFAPILPTVFLPPLSESERVFRSDHRDGVHFTSLS
jgi:hypothetical protein